MDYPFASTWGIVIVLVSLTTAQEYGGVWPDGRITYTTDLSVREVVTDAVAVWGSVEGVSFVEGTLPVNKPHVKFVHEPSVVPQALLQCATAVSAGYNASHLQHLVEIHDEQCSLEVVLAAVGIVLGLKPMHTRWDRDKYTLVDYATVQEDLGLVSTTPQPPPEQQLLLWTYWVQQWAMDTSIPHVGPYYEFTSIMQPQSKYVQSVQSESAGTTLSTTDTTILQCLYPTTTSTASGGVGGDDGHCAPYYDIESPVVIWNPSRPFVVVGDDVNIEILLFEPTEAQKTTTRVRVTIQVQPDTDAALLNLPENIPDHSLEYIVEGFGDKIVVEGTIDNIKGILKVIIFSTQEKFTDGNHNYDIAVKITVESLLKTCNTINQCGLHVEYIVPVFVFEDLDDGLFDGNSQYFVTTPEYIHTFDDLYPWCTNSCNHLGFSGGCPIGQGWSNKKGVLGNWIPHDGSSITPQLELPPTSANDDTKYLRDHSKGTLLGSYLMGAIGCTAAVASLISPLFLVRSGAVVEITFFSTWIGPSNGGDGELILDFSTDGGNIWDFLYRVKFSDVARSTLNSNTNSSEAIWIKYSVRLPRYTSTHFGVVRFELHSASNNNVSYYVIDDIGIVVVDCANGQYRPNSRSCNCRTGYTGTYCGCEVHDKQCLLNENILPTKSSTGSITYSTGNNNNGPTTSTPTTSNQGVSPDTPPTTDQSTDASGGAPTTTDDNKATSDSPTSPSLVDEPPPTKKTLDANAWLLAAIILGCIIALFTVFFVIFFFYKRRRHENFEGVGGDQSDITNPNPFDAVVLPAAAAPPTATPNKNHTVSPSNNDGTRHTEHSSSSQQ